MAKKNTYISTELEWAEEQLHTWKKYIDDRPIDQLKDRIEWKPTSKGGVIPMVIASIEQQVKSIQDTMVKYLQLLEVVDKLREKEEAKREARGNSNIPNRMRKNSDDD